MLHKSSTPDCFTPKFLNCHFQIVKKLKTVLSPGTANMSVRSKVNNVKKLHLHTEVSKFGFAKCAKT